MNCALCQQPRELHRSHVIPEFLYKTLYDEKHRMFVLSTNEAVRNRYQQKGVYEYLLCAECEARFSRYERHVSLALGGGIELGYQVDEQAIVLSGLDYTLFRLFQMSVLWRASISKHPFFKFVELGVHEEQLRTALLNEEPGDANTYGCIMYAIVHDGQVQQDLILQPEHVRIDKLRGYRFVFGGFAWIYVVASHRSSIAIERLFLQKNGHMVMLMKKLNDFPDVASLAKALLSQGKLD